LIAVRFGDGAHEAAPWLAVLCCKLAQSATAPDPMNDRVEIILGRCSGWTIWGQTPTMRSEQPQSSPLWRRNDSRRRYRSDFPAFCRSRRSQVAHVQAAWRTDLGM